MITVITFVFVRFAGWITFFAHIVFELLNTINCYYRFDQNFLDNIKIQESRFMEIQKVALKYRITESRKFILNHEMTVYYSKKRYLNYG